jgi:hypothetical protein
MLQLWAKAASWRAAETLLAGAGGKVDWGHLGADVKRYGDGGRSYEMVGDEINALPAPPPPPAAAGPGPGSAAALNGAGAPAGAPPGLAVQAEHECLVAFAVMSGVAPALTVGATMPRPSHLAVDGLRVVHVFMLANQIPTTPCAEPSRPQCCAHSSSSTSVRLACHVARHARARGACSGGRDERGGGAGGAGQVRRQQEEQKGEEGEEGEEGKARQGKEAQEAQELARARPVKLQHPALRRRPA